MFTGIVEGMATLRSIKDNGDHIRWVVDLPTGNGAGLEIGASVALDGVCPVSYTHLTLPTTPYV